MLDCRKFAAFYMSFPRGILAAKDQTTRLSDWHKTLGDEATERIVLFKVRIGTSPELVQTSLRQHIPRARATEQSPSR
jgi:hypothetical protein